MVGIIAATGIGALLASVDLRPRVPSDTTAESWARAHRDRYFQGTGGRGLQRVPLLTADPFAGLLGGPTATPTTDPYDQAGLDHRRQVDEQGRLQ